MTVNYTTNLALGQPVTGTESGTWGDDVNNAVTSYLDIAIAGGLAVTVTTADVTLTLTQGTSSATNIGSTTAQYAILNVSGAMTAARNLIVPSSSRQYVINNNTTGGFALTVKGSATSGVTMVNGEKAHVFWNGSDYAKLSNAPGGAGTFSSITNTGLTSGRVVYSTTGGLETDSANLTFDGTNLTLAGGTANGVTYLNGSKVLTSGSALTFDGTNLSVSPTGAQSTSRVLASAGQTATLQVGGNANAGGTTSLDVVQDSSNNGYLFQRANAPLIFGINNAEKMRIASAAGGIGAVGIGYTSLTSVGDNSLAVIGNVLVGTNLWDSTNKLQVAGRIGATGFANTIGSYAALTASIQQGYPSYGFAQYLVVENAVNNSYGMAIYTTSVGTQAERMRIDSSGNLGIGTNSPSTYGKLAVIGTSGTQVFVGADGASNSVFRGYGIGITGTAAPYGSLQMQMTTGELKLESGNVSYGGFQTFYTAGSERMRIDSSGNLGIGTVPAYKLDVLGVTRLGGTATSILSGVGTAFVALQGELYTTSTNSMGIGTTGAATVNFYTNSVERMRIDSSGRLLVGDISSNGNGSVEGIARSNATPGIVAGSRTSGDVGSAALLITKFDNNSTTSQIFQQFSINNNATANGQINANGASQVAFGSWSDVRLKENIVDLPSQLANIMALRPVEYDYIETEGGGHQIGFVAQEVQAIYPDLVGERVDGMLTLSDMNKNDARLIKAIQEQQALITSLTARITALESKEIS